MGNVSIDSELIEKLVDEKLLIKDEHNDWSISQQLLDNLKKFNSNVPKTEVSRQNQTSINTAPTPVQSKSGKYRPAMKRKSTTNFLDALNFDLKESNFQTRIKSQIRQGTASAQVNNQSQNPEEIDDLFDDALGETMSDFLSDFEDVIIVEKKEGKPVISTPLINILREQGYIKTELSTEEELQRVPEYEVLRTIIKQHPIPLTELEEKTTVDSLSLVLSNLQADNLIVYTNDYKWTISKKVKENLIEFMSQVKDTSSENIEELRNKIHRKSKYERQFITAMYRLKYIDSYDMGLIEMTQIPEIAILKAIKDNEPVEFKKIQMAIPDIPPVQITRIMAQLEGKGRIIKNSDGLWELTEQFVKELVKE